MGLVDTLSQEEIDAMGSDAIRLLQIYETTYPPDIAIVMSSDPSIFDFDIYGGDIGIAGYYITPTYESIIQVATQDLLFRISVDKNTSILFPSVGNTNIVRIPAEAMRAAITMAISESPFIQTLQSLSVTSIEADVVEINLKATTPTGDSISIGFTTGGTVDLYAQGSISVRSPLVGDIITVNGLVYTAVTGVKADYTEFSIDSTDIETAADISDSILNDSRTSITTPIDVTTGVYANTSTVIVQSVAKGVDGNKIDLSSSTINRLPVSGRYLSTIFKI